MFAIWSKGTHPVTFRVSLFPVGLSYENQSRIRVVSRFYPTINFRCWLSTSSTNVGVPFFIRRVIFLVADENRISSRTTSAVELPENGRSAVTLNGFKDRIVAVGLTRMGNYTTVTIIDDKL